VESGRAGGCAAEAETGWGSDGHGSRGVGKEGKGEMGEMGGVWALYLASLGSAVAGWEGRIATTQEVRHISGAGAARVSRHDQKSHLLFEYSIWSSPGIL
jgi:hypothetical protein